MALQHLRSSTANKRPTPAAMSDGQLAMNTNLVSPGLFFKDSNGDLVKIGPVHVGATAPNVSPGAGGQAGNSKGEQWLDTSGTNPVLKIWDGSAWQSETGEFVNASGDTMTGALVMGNQQQVRFSEASGNGTNFIALQAPASVASDKTITLPDVTGTVVTTGDTGSVSSAMLGTNLTVSAAAGSAAAPSITFTGDLNTGIYSPAADTIAFTEGGAETMRIDSSARLLVGTSTARSIVDTSTTQFETVVNSFSQGVSLLNHSVGGFYPNLRLALSRTNTQGGQGALNAGTGAGAISFAGSDGVTFREAATITGAADAAWASGDAPGRLMFSTTADGASSPTERMRIDNAGQVQINDVTATGVGLIVREINTGTVVVYADSTRAQDTTWYSFYATSSTSTVLQSYIRGDGAYGSRTNVYGGLSDIKLKENIEPAGSQWSDIKSLQVKKFNFIGDGLRQIGVIAQEVEEVSPGLVDENIDRDSEGNDLGTVTKSVKYSILYMKAVKALQEAMERIETLEGRLTAAGIA